MRIALDATPAAVQQAGVGRYTRELAAALVTLPDDDHYVLVSAGHDSQSLEFLDTLPPGQYRELRRLPLRERYMTAAWQRLRIPLPVERLIGPFDVYHGTDFVVPPSKRPRVVTIHDLSFLRHPEFAEPRLAAYLRSAVPRALASATCIITVSATVAADVAEAYPSTRERLVAVVNGVRVPPRLERHEASPPVILLVGTIEPRKNIPNLLRAMPAIRSARPGATLVIAGRVGWRSAGIVDAIRESERAGRVRFVEAPDDAALERLYGTATLVVYPSFYEGFGLPVLEAMYRGVPVVASAIPSLTETGGDAAVFADPHNPGALADAINALLDDATLRREYAERGRSRAAMFSWEQTARRTRRVYQRAYEESGR